MPRNLCMIYLITAAVAIIADQLVKYWVRAALEPGDVIRIIGDFFTITRLNNSGAALGVLSGQRIVLIVVPILVIAVCMWYLLRHKDEHWTCKLALTLIMAGGFGNLIDRALFGEVTDMFSLSIFPPIFNLADVCVTFGCVLLIVYILFLDRPEKKGR